jgi:hypothetical protein
MAIMVAKRIMDGSYRKLRFEWIVVNSEITTSTTLCRGIDQLAISG